MPTRKSMVLQLQFISLSLVGKVSSAKLTTRTQIDWTFAEKIFKLQPMGLTSIRLIRHLGYLASKVSTLPKAVSSMLRSRFREGSKCDWALSIQPKKPQIGISELLGGITHHEDDNCLDHAAQVLHVHLASGDRLAHPGLVGPEDDGLSRRAPKSNAGLRL